MIITFFFSRVNICLFRWQGCPSRTTFLCCYLLHWDSLYANIYTYWTISYIHMRWRLHIMLNWRQQSFCTNSFKILKMSHQNWLWNFMWYVQGGSILFVIVIGLLVPFMVMFILYEWFRYCSIWDQVGRNIQCHIKLYQGKATVFIMFDF